MTSGQQIKHGKTGLSAFILASLMILLLMPLAAFADNFVVWGRAYSATPLVAGEDAPNNPLSDVPAEQIIGKDLIAQVSRNLVKVKVIATSDGTELGSFMTRHDGGYLVSFNATPDTPSGISVRLVVEELATSKTLLSSGDVVLSAWPTPNIRFLLVNEDLSELSGDIEYPSPPGPGQYTGIFTRVGKVELPSINQGSGSNKGLATVSETVSNQLGIPRYENAPFGGRLYLFGAFSQDLYSPPPPALVPGATQIYYKIRIDSDTNPTSYMRDALFKTKYTVNFTTGSVDTERVKLGPGNWDSLSGCIEDGVPVCYKLTQVASDPSVFWSFPDLLANWNTASFNGNYRVILKEVGMAVPSSFVDVDYTDLKLRLDNIAPVARIEPLDAIDADDPTPRIYIPDPAAPGISGDLQSTRLGDFPDDYAGTANPICAILNLEGPVGSKYLAFKITAYHANGFLRHWKFHYKRNDSAYQTHIGKTYQGGTMDDVGGQQLSSSATDVHGFQNQFLYLNNDYLQPSDPEASTGSCGYRFAIRASTRTTNGYHYLRHRWDEDIHYLIR